MDEKSSQEITAEILIELMRHVSLGGSVPSRENALEAATVAGEMFKAICRAVNHTMSPRFALNLEGEEERA